MSNPTLSEALQDAYASAPADRAIINTLSIWYDGLEVEGDPSEIYIYDGFAGNRETADGVPLKDFRLEAAARYAGGGVVEFIAVPFDVTMPQVASQQIVKAQLMVDGVGREIADAMMSAIALGKSIEVTYRAFLEGMEYDGPQNDPPLVFHLSNVQINAVQVRGDITPINVGGRRFPGESYRPSRFPAIR